MEKSRFSIDCAETPTGLTSAGYVGYPGFGNPGLKDAIPLGLTLFVVLEGCWALTLPEDGESKVRLVHHG